MARIPSMFINFSLIFSSLTLAMENPGKEEFERGIYMNKKEKVTYFRLYWHDIVGGSEPTSVEILASKNNTTMFGCVHMFDNPLTIGPDLNSSKIVGKAQGFYAGASQEETSLLMSMNFAFTYGTYNGSTISVFGKNSIYETEREMSVIGGSGRFRFARGYAQATTYSFNTSSKDAIVEYHICVLHY